MTGLTLSLSLAAFHAAGASRWSPEDLGQARMEASGGTAGEPPSPSCMASGDDFAPLCLQWATGWTGEMVSKTAESLVRGGGRH